jgi:hypothetical protein
MKDLFVSAELPGVGLNWTMNLNWGKHFRVTVTGM